MVSQYITTYQMANDIGIIYDPSVSTITTYLSFETKRKLTDERIRYRQKYR
jgi:hypothetical protein